MSGPANPAASFYAGGGAAAWIGRGLRALSVVAPALAERAALRLFFTPMPLKIAARRRPSPAGWRIERWPFEGVQVAIWQRGDERTGAGTPRPRSGGEPFPYAVPGAAGTAEAAAQRPPVLLVHGWGGDALQMRPLAEALHEAGFAPLLLEFPGHGRSDGWRSTLPQFVRAMFAVQARVGPLHAVVGHSLGALAAAQAAARGLGVQRLALLATSSPPAIVLRWFGRLFALGDALTLRMQQAIESREGIPLRCFEPGWLGPRLRQPVLLVHDAQDRAAPFAATHALAAALPDARLRRTDGLSHRRVLSDPAVIGDVVAHLRGDAAAQGR